MFANIRDKIINIYNILAIDAILPDNIYSSTQPLNYMYENIYNVIKQDPKKYMYVIDMILNDKDFIEYFPVYIRNAISMLYPEDSQLTATLMIDTTSYYKCKRTDTGEYNEDGEPIEEEIYHLVQGCPQYYFMMHFYKYYNINPTLRYILDNIHAKPSDMVYYKMSPELIKYYNDRQTHILSMS